MNLNEDVWVKLTAAGHEHLNNLVRKGEDYISASERSGEFHLWRLMQVFGSVHYLGMPEVMFEKNEIFLTKP